MDSRAIKSVFKSIAKDVKFAQVVALTQTAKDIQEAIVKRTKRQFTIRKNWVDKGKYSVRVRSATKRRMVARVWNDAPWIVDHEEGKQRQPEKKFFAIPTSNLKKNKKGLITKSKRPSNLKRSFVITKDGNKTIFQRKNKKTIVPMYNLKGKAKIEGEWNFVETGEKVFKGSFDKNLDKAIKRYVK